MSEVMTPPDPPNGAPMYLTLWFRTFIAWIARELRRRPTPLDICTSIRMASPDGTVYRVTVDNAGALGVTAE